MREFIQEKKDLRTEEVEVVEEGGGTNGDDRDTLHVSLCIKMFEYVRGLLEDLLSL